MLFLFGDGNINYRYIRNTSLYVSELCYGTMTFGANTDVDVISENSEFIVKH